MSRLTESQSSQEIPTFGLEKGNNYVKVNSQRRRCSAGNVSGSGHSVVLIKLGELLESKY